MSKKIEITGMYDVLEALEAALDSAEPTKRKSLSDALSAYAEDFPEEYFWATGAQAPVLLHHLMNAIDREPLICPKCNDDKNNNPKTPDAYEVGHMFKN